MSLPLMEVGDYGKKKYVDYNDRVKIEVLYNTEKNTPKQIGEKLGYAESTIYRELNRGWCENLDYQWRTIRVYSAQVAQQDYNRKASKKGAKLKIGNDHALAAYIEDKMINHKYSPDAVLYEIKRKAIRFSVTISRSTLYKYINDKIFLTLNNSHLPYGKRPRKKKHEPRRISYKNPLKESIENRPKDVLKRLEFGHWEMDTVYSDKSDGSTCLLVLTGRKTRAQIAVKMSARTGINVIKALDRIERDLDRREKGLFAKVFKSIAVDNGSEFADFAGIERSYYKRRSDPRTKVYYCHPFCSGERGSNENNNRMIRRFIPKGSTISDYTHAEIARIITWINNYPRGIFNGYTSNDMFYSEMKAIMA